MPIAELVTMDPSGADERVEFEFRLEPSPYAFYEGNFAWQPR
jgi:hypothetical protein